MFDVERRTGHMFAQMSCCWPFNVMSRSVVKPIIQVQNVGTKKKFHPEEVSSHDPRQGEEIG